LIKVARGEAARKERFGTADKTMYGKALISVVKSCQILVRSPWLSQYKGKTLNGLVIKDLEELGWELWETIVEGKERFESNSDYENISNQKRPKKDQ